MGRGCCGVINLEFSLKAVENSSYISHAFGDEFFSFYDFKEDRKIFKIKEDLLLKNYQSFLVEFYDIIEDKPYRYEEHALEEDALQISDMNSFLSVYDKDNRNRECPYVPEPGMVSSLGRCWFFYSGTYKAYVDSYITYIHFKRILIRVMKNPLAKLVEFYDIINESTDALLIDKEAKKDMLSFGDTYRREALPYIADRYDISTIVGSTPRPIPWIFYEERYGDAYFETYETLKHFSRVLIKAMKNPLAKAVHFGELN